MYYLFITRDSKCPKQAIVNLSEYGNEEDWQFGNLPDALRAFNRTVNYLTVHGRKVYVQLVTYTLCNCVKIIKEVIKSRKILLNDETNVNCNGSGNTPIVIFTNPTFANIQALQSAANIELTITGTNGDCTNIAITQNSLLGEITISNNIITYQYIDSYVGPNPITDSFKFSVMNMVTGCFVENEILIEAEERIRI